MIAPSWRRIFRGLAPSLRAIPPSQRLWHSPSRCCTRELGNWSWPPSMTARLGRALPYAATFHLLTAFCGLFTSVRRVIIHLDMDCFYAAIEVRDNPELT